jgi:hypothetical protein
VKNWLNDVRLTPEEIHVFPNEIARLCATSATLGKRLPQDFQTEVALKSVVTRAPATFPESLANGFQQLFE